jgi:hypothetical protein
VLAQPASQRGRQLRVHEEPHGSGRGQDGVVNVDSIGSAFHLLGIDGSRFGRQVPSR